MSAPPAQAPPGVGPGVPSPPGTGGIPSVGFAPGSGDTPHRGIASLTWGGRTLRFRTNPNEIWWTYSLLTGVTQTYGGRVVQILGVKMDDLSIKVDCGRGGWPYAMQIVRFMRDLMVDQRNGQTATFEYTTRGYRMDVYAASVPFEDQVTSTVRELELKFKIQQDVSGAISTAALSDTLQSMASGSGFQMGSYGATITSLMSWLSGNAGLTVNPGSSGGGGNYLQVLPGIGTLGGLGGMASGGLPGLGSMSGLLGGFM